MKIRIFSLAKELGMDSKVLIGWCLKLGIDLKDSPLSSISEEQRDQVLEFIKSQGQETGEAPKASAAATPTREASRLVGGKVPTIRPVVAPSRPSGSREDDRTEVEVEVASTADQGPETATPGASVSPAPSRTAPPSAPQPVRGGEIGRAHV